MKYKSALADPKCVLIVTNSVFVTPNSVFVLSALRLGENRRGFSDCKSVLHFSKSELDVTKTEIVIPECV